MTPTQTAKEERRLKSINGKLSRMNNEVTGMLLEGIHHEKKIHDKFEKRISRLESLVGIIGGKLEESLKDKGQKSEDVHLNLAMNFDKDKKLILKKLKTVDGVCQTNMADINQFQQKLDRHIR